MAQDPSQAEADAAADEQERLLREQRDRTKKMAQAVGLAQGVAARERELREHASFLRRMETDDDRRARSSPLVTIVDPESPDLSEPVVDKLLETYRSEAELVRVLRSSTVSAIEADLKVLKADNVGNQFATTWPANEPAWSDDKYWSTQPLSRLQEAAAYVAGQRALLHKSRTLLQERYKALLPIALEAGIKPAWVKAQDPKEIDREFLANALPIADISNRVSILTWGINSKRAQAGQDPLDGMGDDDSSAEATLVGRLLAEARAALDAEETILEDLLTAKEVDVSLSKAGERAGAGGSSSQ